MTRTSQFLTAALLLAVSVLQSGCGSAGASQPMDARKYWDKCLGIQCPPMDEADARKK
jgi:hypothetical protein